MSTFERVVTVISNQFSVEKDSINANTSFANDLNVDSLDIVELLMAFEDEFDMEISDEASSDMKTVGDIVTYIENNLE